MENTESDSPKSGIDTITQRMLVILAALVGLSILMLYVTVNLQEKKVKDAIKAEVIIEKAEG